MLIQYILMRTDLASLNPGKAMAQSCHAANQCVAEASPGTRVLINEWAAETGRGFGTTIVLGVTGAQLLQRIALAKEYDLHAGITHDPTYPLRDGEVTHLIPLDTCGYIFSTKEATAVITSSLNLMD